MKTVWDLLPFITLVFTVVADGEFSHNTSSDILRDGEMERIRGFSNRLGKDIVFGGLFAVHRRSIHGNCSTVLVKSGLERVEAFLYAIDKINSDPTLLPNISLGFDIRDTCILENIGLDESFSLVSTGKEFDSGSCDVVTSGNHTKAPIAGIIGPTISPVALPVAGLLRLFTIPQISFSASASALSNRDRYGYFFRTIPPDDHQAQAMVELAIRFNWTSVSVLHSNDDYGEDGSEVFRQLADSAGICVDLDIGLDDHFQENDYTTVALKLFEQSNASVVVFFASTVFVDRFMDVFNKTESSREFLWIASDSWGRSTVRKYPNILDGRVFGFSPLLKDNLSEFEMYFSELSLLSNSRNAWFPEYFRQYNPCAELDSSSLQRANIFNCSRYTLSKTNVELVIDAVYSLAHAVNDFLNDNCDLPVKWDSVSKRCQGQKREMNGTVLRQYLQEVNFISPFGKHIMFDDFGNPEPEYGISISKRQENGDYKSVRVGLWIEKELKIDEDFTLQIGRNGSGLLEFESSCTKTCPNGSITLGLPSSCCAICSPCLGNYTNNFSKSSECVECPKGMWGNDPLVGSSYCEPIRKSYLSVGKWFGILLVILAFFGLICVVIVCIAMGILWKNPMIKSSGREQMVVLLCGVTMCFLITVFFLVEPSPAVCFFQRAGTWFCFSLMLSALLVKLIRIARIFLRSHTSKPPRFIQPIYQIIFTMALVGIQMLLVLVSLIVVHPKVAKETILNRENTNDHPVLLLKCSAPDKAMIAVHMLYYSILLLASNFLALLTIRFPENFNEVRYVAFTTFCVGLVWLAFLVSFFVTEEEYRSAVVSFSIQISAIAVLFCFYCPRIFAAIWIQSNWFKVFGSSSSPYNSSTGSKGLSLQFASEKKLSLPTSTIDSGELKDLDSYSNPYTASSSGSKRSNKQFVSEREPSSPTTENGKKITTKRFETEI